MSLNDPKRAPKGADKVLKVRPADCGIWHWLMTRFSTSTSPEPRLLFQGIKFKFPYLGSMSNDRFFDYGNLNEGRAWLTAVAMEREEPHANPYREWGPDPKTGKLSNTLGIY